MSIHKNTTPLTVRPSKSFPCHARHLRRQPSSYAMSGILHAHMSSHCHSERQRRIWRAHLMYIIVSQILHSACGFVQDDRWCDSVQDGRRSFFKDNKVLYICRGFLILTCAQAILDIFSGRHLHCTHLTFSTGICASNHRPTLWETYFLHTSHLLTRHLRKQPSSYAMGDILPAHISRTG